MKKNTELQHQTDKKQLITAKYEPIISSFTSSQDIKDSSRGLYIRTLRIFFTWIEESERNLEGLTRADIIAYKEYLMDKGLSSLSVSSYLTSLKRFYEWAEGEKLYPNIAKGVKLAKRVQCFKKQHLPDEKSVELLHYFHSESLRNYAIVNLILRTGLRTVEVVRADISDITFKGGRRILKVWGKGRDGKDDYVILTDKAYQPIFEYLKTRYKPKANEPLFTSDSNRNTGKRLTTRAISGICKDGLRAIGLDSPEFTAHSLRHTTAVTILKHGGSMEDCQTVLRHSNPATTQIYTESIKDELRLSSAPEGIIDKAF